MRAPARPSLRLLLLATLGFGRLGAVVLPGDIDVDRELIIRDLAVVDSAEAEQGNASGRLTLQALLRGMAGKNGDAKAVLLSWLHAWTVSPSGGLDPGAKLIREWKRRDNNGTEPADDDWQPDFEHAPFRLLAITYRPDLQKRDRTGAALNAGEARFAFCLTGGYPDEPPLNGTVIFEYGLGGGTDAEVQAWAKAWHDLSAHVVTDPLYLDALVKLTGRFTAAEAAPGQPNNSALLRIRTNELALSGVNEWRLREFHLAAGGSVSAAPTAQTPPDSLQLDSKIADYINANASDILNNKNEVPAHLLGDQAGVPSATQVLWKPSNVSDPAARYYFALNTCNGCHGVEGGGATGQFTHLHVRMRGKISGLSKFLTPGQVPEDPNLVPHVPHPELQEVAYRQQVMAKLLNGTGNSLSSHWTLQEMALHGTPPELKPLLQLLASRRNRAD